ncbi:MAG: EAL domain-containing protein [Deltaproteobacteria bacterium]|nr:EAL domain-containing protein [Deltaproteobacteria bacterium]
MNDFDKRKILIVDDVPTNITVLTEILMSDYKMVCATNGKDALKLAASSVPDLILLDIMMPDMDGYEACRQLKSDDRTKNIPVIFLTAKKEEEDEVKGLELGAVDYISKPFSSVILRHKVRIHMELKLHRDNLEDIIRERTIEISKSHYKLHQEITERIQVQKALIEQRAYFLQLFENSPQAIMIVEPDGKVVGVNKGFEKIFGYAVKEIKGQYNKNLIVPEDMVAEDETFHQNILSGKIISKETFRLHKNGELIPVSFLGYPAVVKDQIEGLFILYRDISERKKFEAQMLHQSFHDSLTGIPNRALLMERLGRSLERSKRRKEYQFAVLMIDLDNFKSVNDSIGHLAGDKFLIQFSDQIKQCIRSTDTIARMGGDEFAVLLEEFNGPREVFKIAKRISNIGKSSFFIERNEVKISASIGIVIETKSYDRAENILRDADIAMYRVKETGKSSFRVFKKKMRKMTLESLKMQNDLRQAIFNDELVLYYQPIVSVAEQELIGFEALVRWQHPVKGMVGPDLFIPLAEETDLILPLGRVVIREACRQLKQWHNNIPGADSLTMNVNISTKQFMDGDLTDFIIKELEENKLAPEYLNLEITESLIIKNAKSMISKLSVLKSHGINVVLDDFGTGYSSLSYIQDFQIDSIKIDRSFINDMDRDSGSVEIVKIILALCRNLGLGVVAEGVERRTQLDILRELNCEKIQGFYFSKPVNKDKAADLIKNGFTILE